MSVFTEICENIYRLTVPYQDIYTTVCLIRTERGDLLFDTASYDSDVQTVILPALRELGVTEETLRYVFVSHHHTDHAGGLRVLSKHFPKSCVVSCHEALREHCGEGCSFRLPEAGEVLLDVLEVVPIPGHTADSAAIYDRRTKTLITGDCLQLYGIYGSGKWGANISYPSAHRQALNKLREMEITAILTAHDYHPYGYFYRGRKEIAAALDACVAPLEEICAYIARYPDWDDEQICTFYNTQTHMPTLGKHVVLRLREAMSAGSFKEEKSWKK